MTTLTADWQILISWTQTRFCTSKTLSFILWLHVLQHFPAGWTELHSLPINQQVFFEGLENRAVQTLSDSNVSTLLYIIICIHNEWADIFGKLVLSVSMLCGWSTFFFFCRNILQLIFLKICFYLQLCGLSVFTQHSIRPVASLSSSSCYYLESDVSEQINI